MPNTPTTRGDDGIHEQPDSPRVRRDARGVQVTQIFRGPFDDLKTYGPDVGDDFALAAFGLLPADTLVSVDEVMCQPDTAGYGTLTIVYSNLPTGAGVLVSNQVIAEIEWQLVDKPVLAHPLYRSGAAKALTDDDRNQIELWKADPSVARYTALTANAKHLVDKLRKGIEFYSVPVPVCRKTTRRTSAPTTSEAGMRRTTVPFSGAPSGYQWLKTADRAIRQAPASGWERVEEWQGGDEVDPDLYATES